MKDKIEFGVDLVDLSYKCSRNIYKVVVYIDDSTYNSVVSILAYYKTEKSKNKEHCYSWQELDKFRFKSSYEEFTVPGLTSAIELLKQKIM